MIIKKLSLGLLSSALLLASASPVHAELWAPIGSDIYYNSGNVGIGTVGPGGKIDVRDSSARQLLLTNSSTGGYSFLNSPSTAHLVGNAYWDQTSWKGFSPALGASLIAAARGYMTFNTAASGGNPVPWVERMRITDVGNVGIGTTTPNATLEVKRGPANDGTAAFWGTNYNSHFNFSTAEDTYIRGGKAGSEVYLNDNHNGNVILANGGGNVGIRTANPSMALTVNGNAWVTSGAWSGSDLRWKKNIIPLPNSLEKVTQLRAVNFDWRKDEFPGQGFTDDRQIGFIAQEVEKIYPELVTTDNEGYKGISYEKFAPVLTKAIQEQQKEIADLKQKIEAIEKKLGN